MGGEFQIKAVEGVHKKKYPAHKYDNIPQHPTCAIFVGTRNSGKSTIMYNLITDAYKKYFHRIIIMTPNINMDELYMELCNNENLDIRDCYPEFDDQILQQLMDKQGEIQEMISEVEEKNRTLRKDEKIKVPTLHRVLVVIDDSAPTLGENKVLKNLFQIGRHRSITTFIVTQKYNQLNTALRANCENLIITRISNGKELKTIADEKNIPILAGFITEMNEKYKYSLAWIDKYDKLHLGFTEKVYN